MPHTTNHPNAQVDYQHLEAINLTEPPSRPAHDSNANLLAHGTQS